MVGSPHPNPLEVVEAAVGVVDAAWTAIERHRDHASHDAAWEDCVKLEGLLAEERSENHRLKAALEECQRALQVAQVVGDVGDFPVASDCPPDLYEQVKKKVESAEFLEKVKELRQDDGDKSMLIRKDKGDILVKENPEDPSWWLWVPEDLEEEKEARDNLDNDNYVVVSQDDVVDGLAAFVARIILSNPHAKRMSPKEVQEVISMSFAKMERKGKLRKLWSMIRFLYISASWTTAAVGLYKNPFIVRALLKGLALSSRLAIKLLT